MAEQNVRETQAKIYENVLVAAQTTSCFVRVSKADTQYLPVAIYRQYHCDAKDVFEQCISE